MDSLSLFSHQTTTVKTDCRPRGLQRVKLGMVLQAVSSQICLEIINEYDQSWVYIMQNAMELQSARTRLHDMQCMCASFLISGHSLPPQISWIYESAEKSSRRKQQHEINRVAPDTFCRIFSIRPDIGWKVKGCHKKTVGIFLNNFYSFQYFTVIFNGDLGFEVRICKVL